MAITKRIDRPIKNAMRARLEHILQHYREIAVSIDKFRVQTANEEYVRFWDQLQHDNDELMRNISRYMVMRCNR
jgi:hypothetical protein